MSPFCANSNFVKLKIKFSKLFSRSVVGILLLIIFPFPTNARHIDSNAYQSSFHDGVFCMPILANPGVFTEWDYDTLGKMIPDPMAEFGTQVNVALHENLFTGLYERFVIGGSGGLLSTNSSILGPKQHISISDTWVKWLQQGNGFVLGGADATGLAHVVGGYQDDSIDPNVLLYGSFEREYPYTINYKVTFSSSAGQCPPPYNLKILGDVYGKDAQREFILLGPSGSVSLNARSATPRYGIWQPPSVTVFSNAYPSWGPFNFQPKTMCVEEDKKINYRGDLFYTGEPLDVAGNFTRQVTYLNLQTGERKNKSQTLNVGQYYSPYDVNGSACSGTGEPSGYPYGGPAVIPPTIPATTPPPTPSIDGTNNGNPPPPNFCPTGYTGTYPNCTSTTDTGTNGSNKCPTGYTGTPPNCVGPTSTNCQNGSINPICPASTECPVGFSSPTCPPVVAGSCGTGSSSTPLVAEPTGTSACTSGTLNSSSPYNTTTNWNWSCGTVTTCTAPKALPNLTADAPTPITAIAGVAQTYNSIIRNTGNASATGTIKHLFQFDNDSNHTASVDGSSTSNTTTTIAVGSTPTISGSYIFAAGTRYVRVCADNGADANNFPSGGTVTESNEGDNCSDWTAVTVPAPVDGKWTAWSPATALCEVATISQTRTCTNPAPSNGGKACTDPTNPNYDGGNAARSISNSSYPCPFGTLSCTTTTNSVTLSAKYTNGANVSIYKGSTRIGTVLGSGSITTAVTRTDTGLASGAPFTYDLRNGDSSTATLFDTEICTTTAPLPSKPIVTILIKKNGTDPSNYKSSEYVGEYGDQIDLKWTVNPESKATDCAASISWSGTKTAGGEELAVGGPLTNENYKYAITCKGPGGVSDPAVFVLARTIFQAFCEPISISGSGSSVIWGSTTTPNNPPSFPGISYSYSWSSPGATPSSSSSKTYSVTYTAPGPKQANFTFTATDARPSPSSVRSALVSCLIAPDLIASAPPENTAVAGTPKTFTSTISNIGNASTGKGFSNKFQTSPVSDGSSGVQNYTVVSDLPELGAPGTLGSASLPSTAPISQSITFPAGTPSTMYVRACADLPPYPDGNITEPQLAPKGEFNNCSDWTTVTMTATPSKPNLTPNSPTPITAVANVDQTYSALVTNNGPVSTGTSPNYFFQKTDLTFGTVDLPYSTFSAPFASGSSSTASSPLIKFGSNGGQVRVCVDQTSRAGGGVIDESNEEDNCSGWTTVTMTQPLAVPLPNPNLVIVKTQYIRNSKSGTTFNGAAYTLSWAKVDNADLCTLEGASAEKNGSTSGGFASNFSGNSKTFTLSCSGPGVSASSTATISYPPPPTNLSATCSTSGKTGTVTWTAPNRYNTFYTRASLNGTDLGAPAWDNNFVGTTKTFTTTPDTSYLVWVNSKATNEAWSEGVFATMNCGKEGVPVPVGNIDAISCTIANGASTCSDTNVTWTTASLISGANTAVTKNNPDGGLVAPPLSPTTSGTNVDVTVNKGTTTFFLYHNGTELDRAAIVADCAATSDWVSGVCRAKSTVTGTVSGSNGTISPASQQVVYNNTTTLSVSPSDGYTASVTGTAGTGCANGTLSGNVYTTNAITANCTVTATFTTTIAPVPVVTITADPISGVVNVVNPKITWSSTNSADSCNATGDWSLTGTRGASGNAIPQGILTQVRTYTYTMACKNAAGTGPSASATVEVLPTGTATIPTVTTTACSKNITSSSATSGGNTISDGGAPGGVTSAGIVWDIQPDPTKNFATKTTNGWALGGPWPGTMTPLASDTTYYVRAYAVNSVGTAYGANETCKTLSATITNSCGSGNSSTIPQLVEPTTNPTACDPGVYTNSPADTTTVGAQAWNWNCGTGTSCSAPKFGCRITTDSNYTLPQYGANGPNNNWGCSGVCSNGSTDYPTCTLISDIPSVTTDSVSGVTQNTATGNGTVFNGTEVAERGITWGTGVNPDLNSNKYKSNRFGSGSFSVNLTGLQTDTLYHIRAYALISGGVVYYGSDVPFKTLAPAAVVKMSGTLTANPSVCIIPADKNDCTTIFSWSITNPEETPTAITANGIADIEVTNNKNQSQSGTKSYTFTSPAVKTFYLYNNMKSIVPTSESPAGSGVSVTASCATTPVNTTWNGMTCVAAPVCVAFQGNPCVSSQNSCGQVNNGTIQCNGSCSAVTPPNSSCTISPGCDIGSTNPSCGGTGGCPVGSTNCGGGTGGCPVGSTTCGGGTGGCPVGSTTCGGGTTGCPVGSTNCGGGVTGCPVGSTTCGGGSTSCPVGSPPTCVKKTPIFIEG